MVVEGRLAGWRWSLEGDVLHVAEVLLETCSMIVELRDFGEELFFVNEEGISDILEKLN